MNIRTKIGKRIYFYRKKKNLTQRELATKCGLKQPIIALYESGMREPPVSKLMILAKFLNISISDLTN